MNWNDPVERHSFATHTASIAIRALWRNDFLDRAVESAERTESPLEATFAAWFCAARTKLLADGYSRFDLRLRPQVPVEADGRHYRLDFALEPMDEWLKGALRDADLGLRVAIELDGHDYHERTIAQVIARNQRDRDLAAMRWTVLHFSGSELHRNPAFVVVEVMTAGADALDHAKAALVQGPRSHNVTL